MTYTLRRIGFLSAVKIAALISAAAAVLPIILLVLLNAIFKLIPVDIPLDVLAPMLAQIALWAAVAGGVSTALTVSIYNVCAPIFGGITLELNAQQPRRKQKEDVENA
jgi:biotin transporter BioY